MNTTAEGDSPFAVHDAAGKVVAVDIAPWGDGDIPNNTTGARKHYKPQYDMTNEYSDGCTNYGCAAFESDHIPVGVRLRIGR